jgi:hypothetical protein
MKDQLLVLIDALLQAKAELNVQAERGVKNAPRTLKCLEAILFGRKLDEGYRFTRSWPEISGIGP